MHYNSGECNFSLLLQVYDTGLLVYHFRTAEESFRNNDYFATFTIECTEITILYEQAYFFC